ncbi:MAG: restriction endonuclease subunit S [Ekhidna sp.]|nr:restriction endonuclease subunit S [Ekhidna sp.]
MEKQKKNPELRFEAFTSDWSNDRLENLSQKIGDGIHSTPKYDDKGEYFFINGNNLVGNEIEVDSTTKRVSKIEFEENKRELGDNSILLSINGTIGNLATYEGEKVLLGKSVCYINLNKSKIDKDFMFSILKTKRINNYFFNELTGSTIKNLSLQTIRNTSINYPKQDEQKQIGSFFKNIDELITKHQKKHNRLVTLKKSMLEKMFPKEGQTVPEIRFKGFEGDWEECEFQEIATLKRGLTYSPSNLRKTGTRVLRSSNIFENRFINRVDDVFVDDTAINIDYVKEGDILITAANGSSKLVGKHALITGIKGKVVHGGFMLLASSNVPLFLNASMSSSWYKKFVNLYTAGGGGSIGNLSKSDLDQQRIYVPADENEQLKIGKYFQNIDTLITNHLEQLAKLKNFKQSLSEKMFV